MPKFKAGDKVMCKEICGGGEHHYKIGEVYTVSAYCPITTLVTVKEVGMGAEMFEDRFELVEEEFVEEFKLETGMIVVLEDGTIGVYFDGKVGLTEADVAGYTWTSKVVLANGDNNPYDTVVTHVYRYNRGLIGDLEMQTLLWKYEPTEGKIQKEKEAKKAEIQATIATLTKQLEEL